MLYLFHRVRRWKRLPTNSATEYERIAGLGNGLQPGDIVLEVELGRPLKKNEVSLLLPVTVKKSVPTGDKASYTLSNGKTKTLTAADRVVVDRPIPEKPPAYEASVILTPEALKQVVEDYLQFDYFVLDCETLAGREQRPAKRKDADIPALDERTNKVFWLALAGPGRLDVIPFGHPNGPSQMSVGEVMEGLRPLIFSDILKVGQNCKFDILSLSKYWGEVPSGGFDDTAVIAHLLDENLHSYRLGDLIEHYFGFSYRKLAREGEPLDTYEFSEVARYVGLDAKLTQLLWEYLIPYIEKSPKLKNIHQLECDIIEALVYAKRHGALINKSALVSLGESLAHQLAKLERDIYAVVGHEFLITSTQQRAKLLYGKPEDGGLGLACEVYTDSGGQSTSDAALQPLTRKHPVVPMLIKHGDLSKLQGTYTTGFLPHIEDDGRIRTNLNQYGARTGRYSSSAPNLQNVKRPDEGDDDSLRSMFISPPGSVLVVGDYGQVEYRLMAHFAGPLVKDSRMLMAFREGIDLHAMTAAGLYDKAVEDVSKEERQNGKTTNFLLIFGGGINKLVQVGWSERQAKVAFEGFHTAYPELNKYTNQLVSKLKGMEKPYAETLWGRRRRLPDIKLKNISQEHRKRQSYAERQAVNHVIQGSAADLNKAAMVRMFRRIERRGYLNRWHLILTVHDEIILEVPERDAGEAAADLKEAMEGVKADLLVPLTTDIHYGTSWASAK